MRSAPPLPAPTLCPSALPGTLPGPPSGEEGVCARWPLGAGDLEGAARSWLQGPLKCWRLCDPAGLVWASVSSSIKWGLNSTFAAVETVHRHDRSAAARCGDARGEPQSGPCSAWVPPRPISLRVRPSSRPEHFRAGLRKYQTPAPHGPRGASHHRPREPLASSSPAPPPPPSGHRRAFAHISVPGECQLSWARPSRLARCCHPSLLDGVHLLPVVLLQLFTRVLREGRSRAGPGRGWGLGTGLLPLEARLLGWGKTLGTFWKPRRGMREVIREGCPEKATFKSGLEEQGVNQGQVFQTVIHLFNKHLLGTYFVPVPVRGPEVWVGGKIGLCLSGLCTGGVRGGSKLTNWAQNY